MDAVVVIPARLGSTRFPRKVLANQTGKPLIQHVYESAAATGLRVVVATDAGEVVAAVRSFRGEAVMTSPSHENGTSRLAEAATLLGLSDDTIVVNVQGDEPELEPDVIQASIDALMHDPAMCIGTVASPIEDEQLFQAPSVVKVVVAGLSPDRIGRALYFSRAPIPHDRDQSGSVTLLQHIGIYAYRVGFLRTYATLSPTPLEQAECLEQLRALEHGHPIAVAVRKVASLGIDTPADYQRFLTRHQARSASDD